MTLELLALALLLVGGIFWLVYRPRKPKLDRPKHVGSEVLSFELPRNWKVEEVGAGSYRNWTIEGSSSAMLVIQTMPLDDHEPFDVWAADFCQTFQETLDSNLLSRTKLIGRGESSFEKTSAEIGGVTVPGISQDFEIRAFDESDAQRASFYALQDADRVVYVMTYAEPGELAVLEPGFRLVLGTLRNGNGVPFEPIGQLEA